MLTRQLESPKRSFFLFGPRATGKSTWLKETFPKGKRIDLLRNEVFFKLAQDPALFRQMVLAESKKTWILVDEVQRLPGLLNEVHSLIEDEGYLFALTGSSARKLKRGQANLLAGRALIRELYPLVWPEFREVDLDWDVIFRFGCLPQVLLEEEDRLEILDAYTGTYLREEIKEEALTRNVESFTRFLEIAGLANAQVTNLSNISRDAGIPRATVGNYFDVLQDTLIGRFLPTWTPKARIKEVSHPKFYFFDCGVLRSVQGRLHDTLGDEERGKLLETYLFNELLAYRSYQKCGGEFSFWRTADGLEVDFIWRRSKSLVGLEVKSTTRWRPEFDRGIEALQTSGAVSGLKAWGVYLGSERLKKPWGYILPLEQFLDELWAGKILG